MSPNLVVFQKASRTARAAFKPHVSLADVAIPSNVYSGGVGIRVSEYDFLQKSMKNSKNGFADQLVRIVGEVTKVISNKLDCDHVTDFSKLYFLFL